MTNTDKFKNVKYYLAEEDGSIPKPIGGRMAGIKTKARGCLTEKTLKRRFPILTWIRNYNTEMLVGDLVAGLTVGLMIIPQALAYAAIAGLPANYGLNSAIFASFLYVILGGVNELNTGPTAIMSLITNRYSSNGGEDYAVLLCFLSGIIEIVAGFVNLGFLINFISQPVISGFTSAAAITIASSQLKALFGLKLKTKGVIDTWIKVIQNLSDFRWPDFTLGIICIIVLCIMKPLRSIKFPCHDPESHTFGQRVLQQVLFFLSVGRNAIVVIITSLIAYSQDGDEQPFTLTGFVQEGIPEAKLPPFSTVINNQTLHFSDIMSDIGIGVVMVPFIGVLDLIAVIGSFTKGKTYDANQEILALGVSTFVGSFFGSMPITACLSRSAVNATSGVRTPAGGFIVGVIVLLALKFLTPAFYFIPKGTLAAVIMCAVMHMVDYEILKPIWRSKKLDLLPLLVTFIGCLVLGLEWGILLGIGVNLAMLLYSVAKPKVKISYVRSSQGLDVPAKYVLVTPSQGMSYPSVSHIRRAIKKASQNQAQDTIPLVIDCSHIDTTDYTAAKGMKAVIEEFQGREQTLIFLELKENLAKILTAIHKDVILCPTYDKLLDMLEHKR